MEVLFENQNTITRMQLVELYKNQYKAANTKFVIFSSVLFLGYLLFCCFLRVFDFSILMVIVALIAVVLRVMKRPVKNANTSFEKLLAYYDDVMPVNRVQFGDKIIVEAPDRTSTIEYRKIDKILSLKHGYVIFDKRTNFFILSRDGFTKGTFEEFKQFLREKCPHVTIPE